MNIAGLLESLKNRGISISADRSHIKLAPGSCVPPELAETLRAHKSEVLDYLRTQTVTDSLFEALRPEGYPGLRKAQVEIAGIIIDGFGITDSDHRRYNVLFWVLGYYVDQRQNHGDHYEALKQEQQRLNRLLAAKGTK